MCAIVGTNIPWEPCHCTLMKKSVDVLQSFAALTPLQKRFMSSVPGLVAMQSLSSWSVEDTPYVRRQLAEQSMLIVENRSIWEASRIVQGNCLDKLIKQANHKLENGLKYMLLKTLGPKNHWTATVTRTSIVLFPEETRHICCYSCFLLDKVRHVIFRGKILFFYKKDHHYVNEVGIVLPYYDVHIGCCFAVIKWCSKYKV